MADDLDSILEAIKGPNAAGGGGGMDPMTLMLMQMQNDRADRAASRQMTIQMVTALAPLVLPMFLGKKEADPIMMTLLSGLLNKNNDGEQLKNFMQMMSAATNMSMEQMKTSMLGIMELKDQQTKKMLEDVGNRDDDGPASGPAAIMREIRLGLGSISGLMAPAAEPAAAAPIALPAPGAAAANPAAPAAKRAPPIVVVLHQLHAIQSGKIKETPAVWAALSTVALQDDALLQALDDCSEDDLQPLFAYCLPHLKASPVLMGWVSADGVAAWVDKKVKAKLMPLIDAARDDGEDDGEDNGDTESPVAASADTGTEPEVLQPEAAEG